MTLNTYVELDSVTLGSNQGAITFTNIPQTYTNLRLVINGGFVDSGFTFGVRVGNGSVDSGSNYSYQLITGDGTTTTSYSKSNMVFGALMKQAGNNANSIIVTDFFNYRDTNINKTWHSRFGNASGSTDFTVSTWRSTSAINTISVAECGDGGSGAFDYGNMLAGTTISLYGIRAEGVVPTPKATGGVLYSDSTYYYHVFAASGSFTPSQSLTADVLVVAGGGGSGRANMTNNNGGAGAGGYRLLTSQSLTTTAYTVQVGAGGAGATVDGNPGSKGVNSYISGSGFTTITSTGGGYSHPNSTVGIGGSGGGGGSYLSANGGAGNEGGYTPVEGFAGGGGREDGNYPAGGGGGAGGVGQTPANNASNGGAGGIGSSTASSWGLATGTGQNISGTVYYAGGGGGGVTSLTAGAGGYGGGGAGSNNLATNNGLPNTGGGAGGSGGSPGQKNGANGGSGIVIVRYAKV